MKHQSKVIARDHACPHCGRFNFMPCEELLGMRHIHMRGRNDQALPGSNIQATEETPELERK